MGSALLILSLLLAAAAQFQTQESADSGICVVGPDAEDELTFAQLHLQVQRARRQQGLHRAPASADTISSGAPPVTVTLDGTRYDSEGFPGIEIPTSLAATAKAKLAPAESQAPLLGRLSLAPGVAASSPTSASTEGSAGSLRMLPQASGLSMVPGAPGPAPPPSQSATTRAPLAPPSTPGATVPAALRTAVRTPGATTTTTTTTTLSQQAGAKGSWGVASNSGPTPVLGNVPTPVSKSAATPPTVPPAPAAVAPSIVSPVQVAPAPIVPVPALSTARVMAAPALPATPPMPATPATPAPAAAASATLAPSAPAPVMVAPMAAGLTGAAPVSAAPVSAAPVLASPVLASTVSASPVVAAPTSAAPVAAAPVMVGPVTVSPITFVPNGPLSAAPVTTAVPVEAASGLPGSSPQDAAGQLRMAPAAAAGLSLAPILGPLVPVPTLAPLQLGGAAPGPELSLQPTAVTSEPGSPTSTSTIVLAPSGAPTAASPPNPSASAAASVRSVPMAIATAVAPLSPTAPALAAAPVLSSAPVAASAAAEAEAPAVSLAPAPAAASGLRWAGLQPQLSPGDASQLRFSPAWPGGLSLPSGPTAPSLGLDPAQPGAGIPLLKTGRLAIVTSPPTPPSPVNVSRVSVKVTVPLSLSPAKLLEEEQKDIQEPHFERHRSLIESLFDFLGGRSADQRLGPDLTDLADVDAGPAQDPELQRRVAGHWCARGENAPAMVAAAVGAPALVLAGLVAAGLWLGGPASASAGDPAEGRSETPEENWTALFYGNVAVGFCYVNITGIMVAAAQDFSAGLLAGGFWVGAYAIGGLLALPIFLRLSPEDAQLGLLLHGCFALFGNLLMIAGTATGSPAALFAGRVVAGMEFGVKYFVDVMNTHLTQPGADRADAVMTTRIPNALGQSCGFLVQPVMERLVHFLLPMGLHRLMPNHDARHEVLPLCFMVCYAVSYLILLLVSPLKRPTLIETSSVDEHAVEDASTAMSEVRRREWWDTFAVFAVCVGTGFSRSFVQSFAESVIVVLLTYEYCVPSAVGAAAFLVRFSVVASRLLFLRLRKHVSDVSALLRHAEVLALCCQPFLFRFGGPGPVALAIFLVGHSLQFNANGTQIGTIAAVAAGRAIPGDPLLNNRTLSLMVFICGNICSWFVGPVVGYGLMHLGAQQNFTSALVVAFSLVHAASTFFVVHPRKG